MEEKLANKHKPIEIEHARGVVITRGLGQGVRITVGDVAVDVVVIKLKGKETRLAIYTGETKYPVGRIQVRDFQK